MDKPLILVMEDMAKDVETVINKYVNQVPANIIANLLTKMTAQLETIYQKQIDAARAKYDESQKEDTEDEKVD